MEHHFRHIQRHRLPTTSRAFRLPSGSIRPGLRKSLLPACSLLLIQEILLLTRSTYRSVLRPTRPFVALTRRLSLQVLRPRLSRRLTTTNLNARLEVTIPTILVDPRTTIQRTHTSVSMVLTCLGFSVLSASSVSQRICGQSSW